MHYPIVNTHILSSGHSEQLMSLHATHQGLTIFTL